MSDFDDASTDADDANADSADDAPDFHAERRRARDLLDDEDLTAFHVGVVGDGEEAETTFSFESPDGAEEGLQSLALLATHLRVVASESGVDRSTVAADAVDLADRLEAIDGRLRD